MKPARWAMEPQEIKRDQVLLCNWPCLKLAPQLCEQFSSCQPISIGSVVAMRSSDQYSTTWAFQQPLPFPKQEYLSFPHSFYLCFSLPAQTSQEEHKLGRGCLEGIATLPAAMLAPIWMKKVTVMINTN